MPGPRRTKTEIERDRAEVARLYLQGWTQAAIGEKLGFAQQQISYDLERIREAWQASALRDFDELRARELAKIDELERTYWDAWVRSCEVAEVETIKAVGSPQSPQRMEKTKRVEGQVGDPRFLRGITDCIDRRCKLLGLDAPTKQHNLNVDITTLSDEQLERVVKGEDVAAVIATTRSET
jgi:hypothetical protein